MWENETTTGIISQQGREQFVEVVVTFTFLEYP